MNFYDLGMQEALIKGLEKENITEPTKVQETVFRKILDNKNLIVQSQTGSGKTLAYLLPLYEKLVPIEKGMKVIVLVPTHELAMQVQKQVEKLSQNSGIPVLSTTIIGEVNITRQIEKLREKPQIIIGTAGRIHELIKKKKITAHTIQTLVIDEADKLLGKNHLQGVKEVIKCCMRDTQILMFSASIEKETIKQAEEIGKNPEVIKVTEEMKIPENIDHIFFLVENREKIETLRKVYSSLRPKKSLVFINRVNDIEEATKKLQFHQYSADCIHGNKKKEERKKVIQGFHTGKIKCLIGTDIAARGLHFEKVSAVFHLTISENPLDYLHRAGRTGRGKERGLSISIITKEELKFIKGYEKAFGIEVIQKNMYKGEIKDIYKSK